MRPIPQWMTCLLLMVCTTSVAQRWTDVKLRKVSNAIHVRGSYVATIKYPGMQLALELPLKSKVFYRGDTTYIKKSRQNRITLGYTFYHHKKFHSNNILTVGHVWRRTNRSNWFVDLEPQVGISRTFINGATYKIVDNKVELKRAAGDWFAVVNIGFSIGKSINKKTPVTGVFVKPSIIGLFPYNNFIYLRPAIQFGMSARLFKKAFLEETVYSKLKN